MNNLPDITIWTGEMGLMVYEEIHLNHWNKVLHTAFLPFVFYATFRGFPAIFSLLFKMPSKYNTCVVGTIMTLYALLYGYYDLADGVASIIYTLPMALLALRHLNNSKCGSGEHLCKSIGYSAGALILQEILGHAILEETMSRITISYILNAILYSPLFYTRYFIEHLPYSVIPTVLFMIFSNA